MALVESAAIARVANLKFMEVRWFNCGIGQVLRGIPSKNPEEGREILKSFFLRLDDREAGELDAGERREPFFTAPI